MIQIPPFKSESDMLREHYSKVLGVPVERIAIRYDPENRVNIVTVEPEVKAQFIQIDVNVDLT